MCFKNIYLLYFSANSDCNMSTSPSALPGNHDHDRHAFIIVPSATPRMFRYELHFSTSPITLTESPTKPAGLSTLTIVGKKLLLNANSFISGFPHFNIDKIPYLFQTQIIFFHTLW